MPCIVLKSCLWMQSSTYISVDRLSHHSKLNLLNITVCFWKSKSLIYVLDLIVSNELVILAVLRVYLIILDLPDLQSFKNDFSPTRIGWIRSVLFETVERKQFWQNKLKLLLESVQHIANFKKQPSSAIFIYILII